jgi:hypothetical protein
MPIDIREKYQAGSEIEAEVIKDGTNVTVAVEFPTGEQHDIKLLEQEDRPISIIIQHLGSEALVSKNDSDILL